MRTLLLYNSEQEPCFAGCFFFFSLLLSFVLFALVCIQSQALLPVVLYIAFFSVRRAPCFLPGFRNMMVMPYVHRRQHQNLPSLYLSAAGLGWDPHHSLSHMRIPYFPSKLVFCFLFPCVRDVSSLCLPRVPLYLALLIYLSLCVSLSICLSLPLLPSFSFTISVAPLPSTGCVVCVVCVPCLLVGGGGV